MALYFAARGVGTVEFNEGCQKDRRPYRTPASVLVSLKWSLSRYANCSFRNCSWTVWDLMNFLGDMEDTGLHTILVDGMPSSTRYIRIRVVERCITDFSAIAVARGNRQGSNQEPGTGRQGYIVTWKGDEAPLFIPVRCRVSLRTTCEC